MEIADSDFTNDSTIVGISMISSDLRYLKKNFQFRCQYIITNLSNTDQYNLYTNSDLGSKMNGYYFELGYDLLPIIRENSTQKFVIFSRYESYNTHLETVGNLVPNKLFDRNEITFGFSWHVADGAVLKADYQFMDDASSVDRSNRINLGFGVWF